MLFAYDSLDLSYNELYLEVIQKVVF
jgi:hypothetical protein